MRDRVALYNAQLGEAMTAVSEGGESVDMDTEEDASHTSEHREERDDLINPFWIEDKDIGRGEVDYLSGAEIQFWKDLIDKYLFPLDADKAKQVRLLVFRRKKINIINHDRSGPHHPRTEGVEG